MDVGDGVTSYQKSRHAHRKAKRSGWNVWKNKTQIEMAMRMVFMLNMTWTARTRPTIVFTCLPVNQKVVEVATNAQKMHISLTTLVSVVIPYAKGFYLLLICD